MVDPRILEHNEKAADDFSVKLSKAAAAGGCPKCASLTVLIPKDKGDPRQCLHCGNKFDYTDITKETE